MIYGRSLCFLALLKLVDFNLSVISLLDIINETFKILYLVSLPCRMSIGGFIRNPSMKVYKRIFFRLSILDPVTVFFDRSGYLDVPLGRPRYSRSRVRILDCKNAVFLFFLKE